MADIRHATPGSIVSSRKVIVSDVVAAGANTKFTIEQPANSIVTDVIFRVLEEVELKAASTQDVGLKVGTTDGGDELVTADTDALLDATDGLTVKAGFALQYAVTGQYNSPAETDAAGVLSNDEGTVYVEITNPASDEVVKAGKLAVEVVFRIFGN